MKEMICKLYNDVNNELTSISVDSELIRCKDCVSALVAEANFVKYCSIWNKLVTNKGYCYLGSKRGATDETV